MTSAPFNPDDTDDLFATLDAVVQAAPTRRARATAKGLRQAVQREMERGDT